jgi:hypothetical protein
MFTLLFPHRRNTQCVDELVLCIVSLSIHTDTSVISHTLFHKHIYIYIYIKPAPHPPHTSISYHNPLLLFSKELFSDTPTIFNTICNSQPSSSPSSRYHPPHSRVVATFTAQTVQLVRRNVRGRVLIVGGRRCCCWSVGVRDVDGRLGVGSTGLGK